MSSRPLGLVLCGGRSARMGRDKALLPWGGTTDLLGHAVARLASVTGDVALLCGPERRYADRGVAVVTDVGGEGGPIAGLLAGLEHAGGRPVLLLGVDLPLAPAPLLAALADALTGGDAAVPLSPRGPEPVCAAYAAACLPAIRARLRSGERGMKSFWPDVRVRQLGPAELSSFGDPEAMFCNVNAPEDLERAAELAAGTERPG